MEACHKLGVPLSREQCRRVLAKMDTDGDGKIHYKELLSKVKEWRKNGWYHKREYHQSGGRGEKAGPDCTPASYYNPNPRIYDGMTMDKSNRCFSFGSPASHFHGKDEHHLSRDHT